MTRTIEVVKNARTLPRKQVAATAGFRTDIQGLRAIAVAAVVLYHVGVPFLPGGYIGVDVFFVISGFLITSHLLASFERDGRIQFAKFYARRARRILPASFAVLSLSLLAALIWYPTLLMREVWLGAVATALYIPNYLFAVQGTNYLAEATPSLFQHYWSLGIEEQFYLVWPALLAAGLLWVRRKRTLLFVVLAVVALSFAACVWLTFQTQAWAFFALPTRAWELGVGGLAAFALSIRARPVRGSLAAFIGWSGVIGIVASAVLFNGSTQFPGYLAGVPVLCTVAVIVAGAASARLSPTAALSVRPMLWLGLISYSLYLVHWPLLQIPQAAVGFERPLPLWVTLLLGAVAVPVAWLMYRFIEEPGRTGKWLTSARPRRTLAMAGAMSVAVALLATAAFAFSSGRNLSVDEFAPTTVITTPPAATDYVPSNLHPSLRLASEDQPQVYEDGCHLDFSSTAVMTQCVYGDLNAPRIVLFGDSHAAQWFPALLGAAEQGGFAVESLSKSSCPSVMADVVRNGVPYTECSAWRDAVIEHINASQPDLVVIANFGSATFAESSDNKADSWGDALYKTLTAINAEVVVMADTPDLRHTPSVCLSANLNSADECGLSREDALSSPTRMAEVRVTSELDVPYIDLTDYMCGDYWCSPILGNTLVYRDAHHLTATFSAELAGVLADRLRGEMKSAF